MEPHNYPMLAGCELSAADARSVSGGGFIGAMRCITGTLLNGAEAIGKTLLYNYTIWGMVRMAAVARECI